MGLTKREEELLKLLNQNLKKSDILKILGIKAWWFYDLKKSIFQKGYIPGYHTQGGGTPPPPKINTHTGTKTHLIRLHSQQFHIKVISQSQTFSRIRKLKDIFQFEGHTIRLWEDSLDVFCSPAQDFRAESPDKAHSLSMVYWETLFKALERKLDIIIFKGLNTIIREVKSHYAELDNELAQTYKKGETLRIRDPEDNKTWLIVDKSLNGDELETIHPESSKEDMAKIRPLFLAIRKGELDPIETDKIARYSLHTLAELIDYLGLNKPQEPPEKQKVNKGIDIPPYIG